MRKILSIVPALTALVLAGAAAGQDDDVNLFISPCGEPFTAPKAAAYPVVKWFNGADANHDGKLDMQEMQDDATRFFKTLDRNHDGVIDGPEVTYYETKIVPEILTRSASLKSGIIKALYQPGAIQPIDPGGGSSDEPETPRQKLNGGQGAVYYSLFREPEPVRSADRNFDYRITLAEFQAHSDRHFKALDVDNKGYLTLADLPKTDAEKKAKAHR